MGDAGDSGELTLRDYVALARRNALLIAAAVVLAIGGALLYSLAATPRYESTASVLLRTPQNHRLFPAVGDSQQRDFVREPAAEFEFVQSTVFSQQANAAVEFDASVQVSFDDGAVSSLNRSALLDFTGRSSDPLAAQRAADIWAATYLEVREATEVNQIEVAIQSVSTQIEALEVEKDEVLEPLRPIDEALLSETDAQSISLLTTQRVALQQALDDELLPIRAQLRILSNDLADLRIVRGFLDQPDISARLSVEAAAARKVAPNTWRNLSLAAVLGGLIGIGLALLKDSLQVSLKTRADVEQVAGAGTVLATVPLLTNDASSSEQSSYTAEIERVVGSVVFGAGNQSGNEYSILVTSPNPGDGKSTLSFELASRLSRGGVATLLIDGDLRKPTLHKMLGIRDPEFGLADMLNAEGPFRVVRTRRFPSLQFVPAGSPTDDAAALLISGFGDVVRTVTRRRTTAKERITVIDSPPLLAVTDAEVMGKHVDGVVLVVRSGRVTRSQLQLCLRRIDGTGARLVGVVMIGVDGASREYGYGYGYGENDGDNVEPLPVARRWRRAVGQS